jgi:hypothetical protein
MAHVQLTASDLTGVQGQDAEFARLVVRSYPGANGAKVLDVKPEEVASLRTVEDLVELELTLPGESAPRALVVLRKEFDKLAENMPALIERARGLRGRPRNGG